MTGGDAEAVARTRVDPRRQVDYKARGAAGVLRRVWHRQRRSCAPVAPAEGVRVHRVRRGTAVEAAVALNEAEFKAAKPGGREGTKRRAAAAGGGASRARPAVRLRGRGKGKGKGGLHGPGAGAAVTGPTEREALWCLYRPRLRAQLDGCTWAHGACVVNSTLFPALTHTKVRPFRTFICLCPLQARARATIGAPSDPQTVAVLISFGVTSARLFSASAFSSGESSGDVSTKS